MPPPPLSAMTVVVDSPTLFRQQANWRRQSEFQFPNLEQHSTGFGFSDLCGGTGGEFESDEWMKSLMDGKYSTGAEKRERIWKKRDENRVQSGETKACQSFSMNRFLNCIYVWAGLISINASLLWITISPPQGSNSSVSGGELKT
ncbi:GRAS domain-containing protein [Forsythia ovata]|uniref:GRAS domain-containing protein n=1 Tax=Forsythia ovata TaxID=205694 RepID=A0ABD1PI14_9LAMI